MPRIDHALNVASEVVLAARHKGRLRNAIAAPIACPVMNYGGALPKCVVFVADNVADGVRYLPAALEDNSGIYGAAAFARARRQAGT